jgi:hypothetical protein
MPDERSKLIVPERVQVDEVARPEHLGGVVEVDRGGIRM